MSYQIEIENLHTCYDLANTQIGEWMPALEGVLQQIQNIQNSDSIEGAAADAMSAYLSEVPTTVIGLLSQAMAEYVSRFLLYLKPPEWTGEYKKTLYDPSKISDETMKSWAREALDDAKPFVDPKGSIGVRGIAKNGLKFEGWIDSSTGEIRSYYPILDWK